LTAFVVDASVALAWLLQDESTAAARALLDRSIDQGALAPALWPIEMANALLVAERRKRISAAERREALGQLALMPVTIEPAPGIDALEAISEVARDQRLSVYDALYLTLARSRSLPLATFDRALLTAARHLAVPVLP
jgi:predicted nucleic acid-binding protein